MKCRIVEVPIRIYYNIWCNTYHHTIFSLAIRIVGAVYRYIVIHWWIVTSLEIAIKVWQWWVITSHIKTMDAITFPCCNVSFHHAGSRRSWFFSTRNLIFISQDFKWSTVVAWRPFHQQWYTLGNPFAYHTMCLHCFASTWKLKWDFDYNSSFFTTPTLWKQELF